MSIISISVSRIMIMSITNITIRAIRIVSIISIVISRCVQWIGNLR